MLREGKSEMMGHVGSDALRGHTPRTPLSHPLPLACHLLPPAFCTAQEILLDDQVMKLVSIWYSASGASGLVRQWG